MPGKRLTVTERERRLKVAWRAWQRQRRAQQAAAEAQLRGWVERSRAKARALSTQKGA